MRFRGAIGVSLAVLTAAAACHAPAGTVLLVTVTLSGSLPSVSVLDVSLTGPAGTSQNLYSRSDMQPISFPTTFTAQLPARITGNITVDVKATDAAGGSVAHGREGPFSLQAGSRQTVVVHLDCGGSTCTTSGVDAGPSMGPDAPGGVDDPSCGNGRIDVDETCDTAIPAGAPGACPPADCNDGVACTMGVHVGKDCTSECRQEEIRAVATGDGCCPTGATNAEDPDCATTCGNGAMDPGETCDTAVAQGQGGACPVVSACDDHDPCTQDLLVAAGTCAAICVHVPNTKQSGAQKDGCCPAGTWSAVDADCPITCGNGLLEPGEACDMGLPPDKPGGCPGSCDDGDPCTLDVRDGTACQTQCVHTAITALISGDGCCPKGGSRRGDRDCPQICGNGAVEPGEACDKAVAGGQACPTACLPAPHVCLRSALVGTAADCTARCEITRVTTCSAARDGCCADGCTAATDPDCSPTCGDGMVQPANGETCDVAIAPGAPGACPLSCTDGLACTRDFLVAGATCQATCISLPITVFQAGDGCCPPGADATVDPDCAAVCGNGVAESPGETCDYAAGAGACPATCPAGDACTPVRLEGAVGSCTAACVARPITKCVAGDGCCPPGCSIASDADCPAVCGDGVRSAGETCDYHITAGLPGACARTCDDADACTTDSASGTEEGCSRACFHVRVTACLSGDGCCPPGCTVAADHDCAPTCGDGKIGAGETCDPPSNCPVSCPDDGDPCTRERLTGDATHCNTVCQHVPVTACSGKTADLCCPTGCGLTDDVDCPGWDPR
jgi:hypothetical protein